MPSAPWLPTLQPPAPTLTLRTCRRRHEQGGQGGRVIRQISVYSVIPLPRAPGCLPFSDVFTGKQIPLQRTKECQMTNLSLIGLHRFKNSWQLLHFLIPALYSKNQYSSTFKFCRKIRSVLRAFQRILSNFSTKFAQTKQWEWLNSPCMFANSVLSVLQLTFNGSGVRSSGPCPPHRGKREVRDPCNCGPPNTQPLIAYC